jgi:hypothetical protein
MSIDTLFGVDFHGPFSGERSFEEDLEESYPRAEQSTNEDDQASDQASNYKRWHLNTNKHARISRSRKICDVTVFPDE